MLMLVGRPPPFSTTIISSASEFTGSTGDFTFSGDDVSSTATNKAIKAITTLTGDFTVTYTHNAANIGNGTIGLYDTTEDATFSATDGQAGMDSMTASYWFGGGANSAKYGSTTKASATPANGSVMTWTRVGSTITFKDDGATYHEYTETFAGEMTLALANVSGSSSLDITNLSWTFNQ